jgi:two-component system, chemotaxis family, protein-glutamate methylesterase/glutaminase
MTKLRVLVVDDQSFMRLALMRMIEADGDMIVVGQARNGVEAVALAQTLKPDAVTMDLDMPEMGGLQASAEILRLVRPRPVIIIVSAHSQEGAAATIEALRVGAVDFISKSSVRLPTDLALIDSELRDKLRIWSKPALSVPTGAETTPLPIGFYPNRPRPDLVVIAASTGGPQTLRALLKALGPIPVPIVIALHMPEFVTACFAEMLAEDTGVAVYEGSHGQALAPGTVTLVPGGRDGIVAPCFGGGWELRLVRIQSSFHPSADALFESAALVAKQPVGVVLTGIGADGARGAEALARKGAPILIQDPRCCVVPGMPEAALAVVPTGEKLAVDHIAQRLAAWSRRPAVG